MKAQPVVTEEKVASLILFKSSNVFLTLLLIHFWIPHWAALAQAFLCIRAFVWGADNSPSLTPTSHFKCGAFAGYGVGQVTAVLSLTCSWLICAMPELARRLCLLHWILQNASCTHLVPWGWPLSLCDPVFSAISCTDPLLQAAALERAFRLLPRNSQSSMVGKVDPTFQILPGMLGKGKRSLPYTSELMTGSNLWRSMDNVTSLHPFLQVVAFHQSIEAFEGKEEVWPL